MSSVNAEDEATMHKSVSASSKAEEYATEFAILVNFEGGDSAWIRFDEAFAVFRQRLVCLLVGSVNGIQGVVSGTKCFRIRDFNTELETHICNDVDGTVIWLDEAFLRLLTR